MMRRPVLAGVAAAAFLGTSLLSGISAPSAGAAESINSGDWNGSTLNRLPCDGPIACGLVKHRDTVTGGAWTITVTVSIDGPATPGCTVSREAEVQPADAAQFVVTNPREVAFDIGATCNGIYDVVADATATRPFTRTQTARLDKQVPVSMPAPTVTGVAATADSDGRAVTVSWDDMRLSAPDLAGYTVERQVGDGSFATIAEPGADQQSLVDDGLPSDGGEATYRVRSRRPAPDGEKVSAQSSSEPVAFSAGTGSGSGAGDEDGGSGAGGGSGEGAGDPAGGQPGDGTGGDPAAGAGRRPGRVAPPRVGIDGTFQPPALGPLTSGDRAAATSTTLDGGYDEDLPYNPVDGPLEAERPEDELAAFFNGESAGRGMAIPIATALVLAVWAFHLRVLARAAKPPA